MRTFVLLMATLGITCALLAPYLGPVTASAAGAPSIYWGTYINGAPANTALLDQFEATVGKHQSLVSWGEAWQMNGVYQPFQSWYMNPVRARGSIPVLNWGSWNLGWGPNQPAFSDANIANGAHDAYIIQWAQAAHAWGQPFFMRFDHEMNGWWDFPWAEQLNGNQPGDYVRMWRHVHDIFAQQGATNVSWVWCPNIVGPQSTSMSELYPGDTYVDWTCTDGYNFGTDYGYTWTPFATVFSGGQFNAFHNTYQNLLQVAPTKPIMIGETASSEHGGSKADWITDMLTTQLPNNYPQIKAFVWFDWNAGDPTYTWPVESSSTSIAAFASGISSATYAANQFATLTGGAIQPLQAPAAPTSGTLTLNPVADSYITWSSPYSSAGGTSPYLSVDIAGTDTTFLLFDLTPLAGKTVNAATLRVFTSAYSWSGSANTFDIRQVLWTDWKEQYMSYTNTVPITNVALGTLNAPSPNTWYQSTLATLPVQGSVGRLFSVAIVGRAWDVLLINSREAGAATAPQLILTYS